jgi:hypothetical protein
MRKLGFLAVLLLLGLPSFAAADDSVIFAGGTVSSIKAGTTGSLDLSSGAALSFNSSGSTFEIPYTAIDFWEQTNELAVHLGVAPTIAVGIVAARGHNHYVRINYVDSNHVTQIVVFQVPKRVLRYLVPALESRALSAHRVLSK